MSTAVVPQTRLTELTLDFLAYLELERGLSRNTLEAYRSDLQQYGEFLAARSIDPVAVTTTQLTEFLDQLTVGSPERKPSAPATVQRKVACLRSFYRHLRREGILEADPTGDLRSPRPLPRSGHQRP